MSIVNCQLNTNLSASLWNLSVRIANIMSYIGDLYKGVMEMKREIWMEADRMEREWDVFQAARPRCMDCGEPILAVRCLPMEEGGSAGYICPRCVRERMVNTEDCA